MSLVYQFYDDPDSLFDSLFNQAFDARVGNSTRSSNNQVQKQFLPRMDIHESKERNELTATFELPGVKKDVSIDVHSNRLTVSGSNSLSKDLEKDGYSIRERRYGNFSRTIPLPSGIKHENIKASMENGVLTVRFPRSPPEQASKRITIN